MRERNRHPAYTIGGATLMAKAHRSLEAQAPLEENKSRGRKSGCI